MVEAVTAGSFIGQLVVNEFVAYLNLAPYLVEGAVGALSPKTAAIVSFALCGFANLSSIAILLGGLGGMAPSRRKDIAKFGLLAVMAGTMSNLMSGTIAGLFVALGWRASSGRWVCRRSGFEGAMDMSSPLGSFMRSWKA